MDVSDKKTPARSTQSPAHDLSQSKMLSAHGASNSSPMLSEKEASARLESATQSWLGNTSLSFHSVYIWLSSAVLGPELQLERCMLNSELIEKMPANVWAALDDLALSRGTAIRSVFLKKSISTLPPGLSELPALNYVSLPNYSGHGIDLRSLPTWLGTLHIELAGTPGPLQIFLNEGTKVAVSNIAGRATAQFWDESGEWIKSEVLSETPLAGTGNATTIAPAKTTNKPLPPLPGSTQISQHPPLKIGNAVSTTPDALPESAAPKSNLEKSLPTPSLHKNDASPREKLESAIDMWLGSSVSIAERTKVKTLLAFAATDKELNLDQKKGLTTAQIVSMPKAVWQAIHGLAGSLGITIDSIPFPKGMATLPQSMWQLPELRHVDLPGYVGNRIDLRLRPSSSQNFSLNLPDTHQLKTIHLNEGCNVDIRGCPLAIKFHFYDTDNIVSSIQERGQVNAGSPARRATSLSFTRDSYDQAIQTNNTELWKKYVLEILELDANEESKKRALAGSCKLGFVPDGVETTAVRGKTAFNIAVDNENDTAVEFFINAVANSTLSEDTKFRLIFASHSNFNLEDREDPLSHWTLEHSYDSAFSSAVKKYGKSIFTFQVWNAICNSKLSNEKKFALIQSEITTTQTPPFNTGWKVISLMQILFESAWNRDNDWFIKYCGFVLDSNFSETQKAALLSAPDKSKKTLYQYMNPFSPHTVAFKEKIMRSNLSDRAKKEIFNAETLPRYSLQPPTPGEELCTAFAKQDVESVIKTTRKIFSMTVSPTELYELLCAQPLEGPTGLYTGLGLAFYTGHKEMIVRYAQVILTAPLSEDQKVSLLKAVDRNGKAGFRDIFNCQNPEAVAMFVRLIANSSLSSEARFSILNGEEFQIAAFSYAFSSSEMITAFSTQVIESSLSIEHKFILLQGKIGETPGFFSFIAKIHADVRNFDRCVRTYLHIVLSSNLPEEKKILLVIARSSENNSEMPGYSALDVAFERKLQSTIAIFQNEISTAKISNNAKRILLAPFNLEYIEI